MFNARRQEMTVSSWARTEAYVGLLLFLIGIAVLAFHRGRWEWLGDRAARGGGVVTSGEMVRLEEAGEVTYGNAWADGRASAGWWVGHFVLGDVSHMKARSETGMGMRTKMRGAQLRQTNVVETKWASHGKGARRARFASNAAATSMAILVTGRHRIEFARAFVILERPGDYVIWGPGVPHSWTALDASTLITVRWPSRPGDQHLHVDPNFNSYPTSDFNKITAIRTAPFLSSHASLTQRNYHNDSNDSTSRNVDTAALPATIPSVEANTNANTSGAARA